MTESGHGNERPADPRRTAASEAERLRRDADQAEQAVDKLGDEALEDYERRRERLAADLTGELPNDSPEPA